MDQPLPATRNQDDSSLHLGLKPPAKEISRKRKIRGRIIAVTIVVLCLGGMISGLCAVKTAVIRKVDRNLCPENMKNVAAAIITYANAHEGHYPKTMEELFLSSGMQPGILICLESGDTPTEATTLQQQAAELHAGGHNSYIYVGKGLTSSAPADTVIMYEPLSNHHHAGMNVRFSDYRVEFLSEKDGEKLIASISIGKPVVWLIGSQK